MEKTTKRPYPPIWRHYFTAANMFSLSDLFREEDMAWIGDLQKEVDAERAEMALRGATMGGPEKYSADPDSDDFPGFYEWPKHMREKYRKAEAETKKKTIQVAQTGKEVTCDDVTLYLNCADGNHYFSTRYFDHGSIQRVGLDEDCEVEFDSVDTAVYAFVNDYREWDEKNGTAHRRREKLLELEALRGDMGGDRPPPEFGPGGCDHPDLGSLGYAHGSIVKCPYCGAQAEVW